MKGYAGRILFVDLTTSEIKVEEPPDVFYRQYLGGAGFISYYLLKEIPKGADPLSPENVLVVAGGTFTGIPFAGAGRNAIGAKSPLTGGYGESEVGGFFGAELVRAGYDGIVIKGQSKEPVYLWINNQEVEIRSAEEIWGKPVKESQAKILEDLGDTHIRTALIGPAGEKLVRFACVINDLKHAAGRTGLGAVMGSKRLKAIAVRGNTPVNVDNEAVVKETSKWMSENWKSMVGHLHEDGSAGNLLVLQKIGALPTRNHSENRFEGYEKISGQAMSQSILVDREGCFACAVRCKRKVAVEDAINPVNGAYGGPEYESIASFGSNCGVDDLPLIAKANELCNAYGMDTISAGGMVAFAMECFEKGLLTKADTGGLDLHFGNASAMLELTRKIAERDGVGDWLADGPISAVERIGGEARLFSMDVKGQQLPLHEGRTRHAHAFGYAMSPTGADHMHNFWDFAMAANPPTEDMQGMAIYSSAPGTILNNDKIRAYAFGSTWQWIHNIICNCMYIPWSKDQLVNLINAITGWKTNRWELAKTCERTLVLARVFNLREGLTSKEDSLPARYFEPIGQYPGIDQDAFEEGKRVYYGIMGWDPDNGVPTRGKLIELDVEWAYDHILALKDAIPDQENLDKRQNKFTNDSIHH